MFTNIELLNKQKHKQCHKLQQTRQIFHQQQKQQQQHQKLQQQQKHHYNLRDSSLSNSVSSDQLNDNSSKKEFDVGYDSDKDDKIYDDDMHSDSADSWSSTSDYDKEDQNLLDTTIESNRIFEKKTLLENRNSIKALLPTVGTVVSIQKLFQLNENNQKICTISYSKWSKLKLPSKILNINQSVKKLINYPLITEYNKGTVIEYKALHAFWKPNRHVPPTNPNFDYNISPVNGT